jgi:uncharacterized protein (DUF362 family)/ferredoxin
MILWVREQGGIPVVGDGTNEDPGGADPFAASGLRAVCDEHGVECVDFRKGGYRNVPVPGCMTGEHIPISRYITDSDIWINLPKLKTHELTLLTGAVKNCYGNIPAGLKREFHFRYRSGDSFGKLVADIYHAFRPALTVMDGVEGMEGEGPMNGEPIHVGVILAGRDATAVDMVAAEIIDLDVRRVFHLEHAGVSGGSLEVHGLSTEEMKVSGFRLPATYLQEGLHNRIVLLCYPFISIRPDIDRRKCVLCGECIERCPVDAVSLKEGRAVIIDRKKCIHCFCCHEFCPQGAIVMKKHLLGRIGVGVFKTMKKILKPVLLPLLIRIRKR